MEWLRTHDRGFNALRRGARGAIIMPALFAIGTQVIGSTNFATFTAFGSFSLLLLVDFTGSIRERLEAQATLVVIDLAFVCLGTLAAGNAWLAAAAMTVVGFVVLFTGVVSSVLAGATPSMLLTFILPVTLPGGVDTIPDRLGGTALAAVASLIAIALLWPAPARDPLRAPAIAACHALSARLRADVEYHLGTKDSAAEAARDLTGRTATEAVSALHRGFLATPYRPTGLTTAARSLVRLVDELNWLNVISAASTTQATTPLNPASCAVKKGCATVLDRGADLLDHPRSSPDGLFAALTELHDSLDSMERNATAELPIHRTRVNDDEITEFVTSLDPSFRAQELSFAVTQVAANIDRGVAAERRSWLDRLLGRQPQGLAGTLAAAQERAAAHVERHSVWLHNSIRGAVALGAAVLVADLSGVQHSFWIVLGTLSVLRSNALNTGQNVLRAMLGTIVGFVIGAALLVPVGSHTAVLWALLPIAILLAGVAPAAISFAAGQAAFTVVLVILFNIIAPAGWRVGVVRIEDIAIGCAVSVAVGLLFWPRGAAAALGQALAEAYADSARYLAAAVMFGVMRCDRATPAPAAPDHLAGQAAASGRRLDDTFRSYLAERGVKPVPLAEMTSLVTGVAGLRLAADAVLDLWQRDDGRAGGDRAAARTELLGMSEQVHRWYDDFAAGLVASRDVAEPLPHDQRADLRLVDAVRHDLREVDGRASATAVRVIWTADHVDAARRLQTMLVGPARATRRERAFSPLGSVLHRPWRTEAPVPAAE